MEQRRADRDVPPAQGARRHPRHRPRDGDPVRRGGQAGQAGARAGAGQVAAGARGHRAGAASSSACTSRDPKIRELLDIAAALEGLNRHAGMHAAGVVIADEPLWDYVPCFRGQNGEIVTQFAMKEVEKAGLVKFDFLGLKTLTVIHTAVGLDQPAARGGRPGSVRHRAHPGRRPGRLRDDLARRHHRACSSSSRPASARSSRSCARTSSRTSSPRCALYRPGPLEGGMVDDFIDRKHGRKPVDYIHPDAGDDPPGHLRGHRLPGAGDADRPGAGRLQPGPRRSAAPRDGQERKSRSWTRRRRGS